MKLVLWFLISNKTGPMYDRATNATVEQYKIITYSECVFVDLGI